VKRKPPEKHFVSWDKNTFTRLMAAVPERLTSRFQVSHGMLLNVLSRNGDGCRAMQRLIRDCHDSPKAKKAHVKRAWQLFRSLVERKVVEFTRKTAGAGSQELPPHPNPLPIGWGEGEAKVRVNVELQADFSMDQTLSLYLMET